MSATPGQTVGPFFGFALPFAGDAQLVPPGHPDAVELTGRVLDGAGDLVPDALVEIWQTDGAGRIGRDPAVFTGFGRAATDEAGRYRFTTVRPGSPFIAMTVFARGLLNRLFTRVYLPDAADDALLSALPADRRRTLIAAADGDRLVFDVRLQGPDETVFLRYE
jgi:protocatechuate 3,4-dioxygenase alpha subunit